MPQNGTVPSNLLLQQLPSLFCLFVCSVITWHTAKWHQTDTFCELAFFLLHNVRIKDWFIGSKNEWVVTFFFGLVFFLGTCVIKMLTCFMGAVWKKIPWGGGGGLPFTVHFTKDKTELDIKFSTKENAPPHTLNLPLF